MDGTLVDSEAHTDTGGGNDDDENGDAELMIISLNNINKSLLFHCLSSLLIAFGSSCKVHLPGERVLEVQESVAPGWNQELWPAAWTE